MAPVPSRGTIGDDTIIPGDGKDILYGDPTKPLRRGRGGNDLLIGGASDDLLVGDGTEMDLTAQGGNHWLWRDAMGAASGGEDLFFFTGLIGKDTVFRFPAGRRHERRQDLAQL